MIRLNENTFIEKIYIFLILLRHGIIVNIFLGEIRYFFYKPKCYCKELRLFRHGKTIAVEKNEFMSDDSKNSALSNTGVEEIRKTSMQINSNLPDVILVAPLKRTEDTYRIIQDNIPNNVEYSKLEIMRGINNSVWAEKNFEMLDEKNLFVFLERECKHNIFAKTINGDSWGDVLVRCTKVLKEVNHKYKNKKVLLVSQGSVYQGLKIILHIDKTPWENYSAMKMFNIKNYDNELVDYGRIFTICN